MDTRLWGGPISILRAQYSSRSGKSRGRRREHSTSSSSDDEDARYASRRRPVTTEDHALRRHSRSTGDSAAPYAPWDQGWGAAVDDLERGNWRRASDQPQRQAGFQPHAAPQRIQQQLEPQFEAVDDFNSPHHDRQASCLPYRPSTAPTRHMSLPIGPSGQLDARLPSSPGHSRGSSVSSAQRYSQPADSGDMRTPRGQVPYGVPYGRPGSPLVSTSSLSPSRRASGVPWPVEAPEHMHPYSQQHPRPGSGSQQSYLQVADEQVAAYLGDLRPASRPGSQQAGLHFSRMHQPEEVPSYVAGQQRSRTPSISSSSSMPCSVYGQPSGPAAYAAVATSPPDAVMTRQNTGVDMWQADTQPSWPCGDMTGHSSQAQLPVWPASPPVPASYLPDPVAAPPSPPQLMLRDTISYPDMYRAHQDLYAEEPALPSCSSVAHYAEITGEEEPSGMLSPRYSHANDAAEQPPLYGQQSPCTTYSARKSPAGSPYRSRSPSWVPTTDQWDCAPADQQLYQQLPAKQPSYQGSPGQSRSPSFIGSSASQPQSPPLWAQGSLRQPSITACVDPNVLILPPESVTLGIPVYSRRETADVGSMTIQDGASQTEPSGPASEAGWQTLGPLVAQRQIQAAATARIESADAACGEDEAALDHAHQEHSAGRYGEEVADDQLVPTLSTALPPISSSAACDRGHIISPRASYDLASLDLSPQRTESHSAEQATAGSASASRQQASAPSLALQQPAAGTHLADAVGSDTGPQEQPVAWADCTNVSHGPRHSQVPKPAADSTLPAEPIQPERPASVAGGHNPLYQADQVFLEAAPPADDAPTPRFPWSQQHPALATPLSSNPLFRVWDASPESSPGAPNPKLITVEHLLRLQEPPQQPASATVGLPPEAESGDQQSSDMPATTAAPEQSGTGALHASLRSEEEDLVWQPNRLHSASSEAATWPEGEVSNQALKSPCSQADNLACQPANASSHIAAGLQEAAPTEPLARSLVDLVHDAQVADAPAVGQSGTADPPADESLTGAAPATSDAVVVAMRPSATGSQPQRRTIRLQQPHKSVPAKAGLRARHTAMRAAVQSVGQRVKQPAAGNTRPAFTSSAPATDTSQWRSQANLDAPVPGTLGAAGLDTQHALRSQYSISAPRAHDTGDASSTALGAASPVANAAGEPVTPARQTSLPASASWVRAQHASQAAGDAALSGSPLLGRMSQPEAVLRWHVAGATAPVVVPAAEHAAQARCMMLARPSSPLKQATSTDNTKPPAALPAGHHADAAEKTPDAAQSTLAAVDEWQAACSEGSELALTEGCQTPRSKIQQQLAVSPWLRAVTDYISSPGQPASQPNSMPASPAIRAGAATLLSQRPPSVMSTPQPASPPPRISLTRGPLQAARTPLLHHDAGADAPPTAGGGQVASKVSGGEPPQGPGPTTQQPRSAPQPPSDPLCRRTSANISSPLRPSTQGQTQEASPIQQAESSTCQANQLQTGDGHVKQPAGDPPPWTISAVGTPAKQPFVATDVQLPGSLLVPVAKIATPLHPAKSELGRTPEAPAARVKADRACPSKPRAASSGRYVKSWSWLHILMAIAMLGMTGLLSAAVHVSRAGSPGAAAVPAAALPYMQQLGSATDKFLQHLWQPPLDEQQQTRRQPPGPQPTPAPTASTPAGRGLQLGRVVRAAKAWTLQQLPSPVKVSSAITAWSAQVQELSAGAAHHIGWQTMRGLGLAQGALVSSKGWIAKAADRTVESSHVIWSWLVRRIEAGKHMLQTIMHGVAGPAWRERAARHMSQLVHSVRPAAQSLADAVKPALQGGHAAMYRQWQASAAAGQRASARLVRVWEVHGLHATPGQQSAAAIQRLATSAQALLASAQSLLVSSRHAAGHICNVMVREVKPAMQQQMLHLADAARHVTAWMRLAGRQHLVPYVNSLALHTEAARTVALEQAARCLHEVGRLRMAGVQHALPKLGAFRSWGAQQLDRLLRHTQHAFLWASKCQAARQLGQAGRDLLHATHQMKRTAAAKTVRTVLTGDGELQMYRAAQAAADWRASECEPRDAVAYHACIAASMGSLDRKAADAGSLAAPVGIQQQGHPATNPLPDATIAAAAASHILGRAQAGQPGSSDSKQTSRCIPGQDQAGIGLPLMHPDLQPPPSAMVDETMAALQPQTMPYADTALQQPANANGAEGHEEAAPLTCVSLPSSQPPAINTAVPVHQQRTAPTKQPSQTAEEAASTVQAVASGREQQTATTLQHDSRPAREMQLLDAAHAPKAEQLQPQPDIMPTDRAEHLAALQHAALEPAGDLTEHSLSLSRSIHDATTAEAVGSSVQEEAQSPHPRVAASTASEAQNAGSSDLAAMWAAIELPFDDEAHQQGARNSAAEKPEAGIHVVISSPEPQLAHKQAHTAEVPSAVSSTAQPQTAPSMQLLSAKGGDLLRDGVQDAALAAAGGQHSVAAAGVRAVMASAGQELAAALEMAGAVKQALSTLLSQADTSARPASSALAAAEVEQEATAQERVPADPTRQTAANDLPAMDQPVANDVDTASGQLAGPPPVPLMRAQLPFEAAAQLMQPAPARGGCQAACPGSTRWQRTLNLLGIEGLVSCTLASALLFYAGWLQVRQTVFLYNMWARQQAQQLWSAADGRDVHLPEGGVEPADGVDPDQPGGRLEGPNDGGPAAGPSNAPGSSQDGASNRPVLERRRSARLLSTNAGACAASPTTSSRRGSASHTSSAQKPATEFTWLRPNVAVPRAGGDDPSTSLSFRWLRNRTLVCMDEDQVDSLAVKPEIRALTQQVSFRSPMGHLRHARPDASDAER